MAVNWTREQKQVIEGREKSLLVSAAAGSGKTAVLVERIIQMITEGENPKDIDRLLVMTFTRAAAAEMRERIQAAIEKKLESEPENEHLQQQAVLVQFAQITTIDSFCLHIMREHFDRLDIDPAFRVGDEGEMLLMRADVMDGLLEDYYRDGGKRYEEFVDAYATGKADGGIAEYVMQVYNFAQSNPWPDAWYEKCREELLLTEQGELKQTEWMQFLLRDIALQAQEWKIQLREAWEICQETGGPMPYLPMIEEDLRHAEAVCGAAGSFETISEALEQFTFSRLAAIRGKNGEVDPEKKALVSDCRSRVKKAVEKLKGEYLFASPEQMLADMEAGKERILELLELAQEFGRRFRAKKKEKNVVDFHDLEHFALEILTEPEAECSEAEETSSAEETDQMQGKNAWTVRVPGTVADEIAVQYDEILVDEYQDSNLVQETLIQCISGERFDRPNVFMVGDVKQSIYRFRMARPELFMEKYNTYTSDDSAHQRIDLHKNFRSRNEVLDFTNDIFYKIMAADLGNVQYDDDAALYPGASYPDETMRPELLLVDYKDEELSEIIEDEDGDKVQIEALLIANRIRSLMENGMVTDKKTGQLRAVQYRDIVILSRSVATWGNTVAAVLKDCDIPAHVESNTGYFSSYEIQVILSMLRILDNPLQDIPMAAVLASPIVGMDDEELAQIRVAFKGVSFAQAVLSAMAGEDGYEDEKLKAFAEVFERLRGAVADTPIHELLYMILDETGFYRYASAMPAGKRRRQNIDMLIEMATAYEKTSYKGLFHFVRYIDIQQKYEIDYGEADTAGENDDVVRIMTIHKSKGLEFPVVFVSGLGKGFNTQDTKSDLVIHEKLGLGLVEKTKSPRTKRPSLIRNEIESRIKRENLGEELRVLYVALTRAKEKIILTGGLSNAQKSFEKYRGNINANQPISFGQREGAGCYLDWIIPAMLSYPDKYTVSTVDATEFAARTAMDMAANDISRAQLIGHISAADETKAKELAEEFDFEYAYASDITKKSKYSVSELKHDSMVEKYDSTEREAERPKFLLEEKETYVPDFARDDEAGCASNESKEPKNAAGVNQGALRGTAVHRVMECLDFKSLCDIDTKDHVAVSAFVKKSMDEMLKKGLITDDMYRLTRPKLIEQFISSDVAARMAQADKRGDLYKEKPFVMDYEGVLVQGIIDVFWLENDKIVLLDYKTDRVNAAKELIDRYSTQLKLYAAALGRIFSTDGKSIQADERLIYSFRLQQTIVTCREYKK